MRKPVTPSTGKGHTEASPHNREARRKAQAAKKKVQDSDNPEGLTEAPHNTLFGKKKRSGDGGDDAAPDAKAKPKQQKKKEVIKTDPAVQAIAQRKKRERADSESAAAEQPAAAAKWSKPDGGASQQARSKPHAEAVDASKHKWERLRSEKTSPEDRSKLIDEVLKLFTGKVAEVLQKHDAARVLQSCFKHGDAAQRDTLLRELKGGVVGVARSHYGHFLLLSFVRHGSAAHKAQILAEIKGHVAELVVHAEGSGVVQLAYTEVATNAQRHQMYVELWGREFALFRASELTSLAALFEADPAAKVRVLKRLEITMTKAARKGLAVTSLVQKGLADLLHFGDAEQRVELVNSLRDAAVHIMHTRDGARIACGCLRHGDAKDRKAVLKALKGFVPRAAQDPYGALVLCAALRFVDDTVLLGKAIWAELQPELAELAVTAHGCLPLLQLLAPASPRHFTPEQLSIVGEADAAASKKQPQQRADELRRATLPALQALCAQHAAALARSPHGHALFLEAVAATLRGEGGGDDGDDDDGEGDGEGGVGGGASAAAVEAAAPMLRALVAVVCTAGEGEGLEAHPLVSHHVGARLLKRLAKTAPGFAPLLLQAMRKSGKGGLAGWAQRGAAWVVLALLEAPQSSAQVCDELAPALEQLAASEADGCRTLSAALRPLTTKGGRTPKAAAAATPGSVKKATPKKKASK